MAQRLKYLPCKQKARVQTSGIQVSVCFLLHDKEHDQKDLGKERVYLAYMSQSEPITEGNQGRELIKVGSQR